jgi:RNase adapter protein RapZ
MHVVIVTGLSGAGKSTALRALEDIGFYCVDNVPLPMANQVVEIVAGSDVDQVAISVDARQHQYLGEFHEAFESLREAGYRVEVLFLEARDELLLRRYSETRRRHPLSGDELVEGIRRDREILAPLRQEAAVVDTSALNVHQLKGIIQERYSRRGDGRLAVTLLSFGFKHGLPAEADLVFDVRFLRNPYFDPVLTGRDGRDPDVATFVLSAPEGDGFVRHVEELLRFSLPQYEHEGKLYLTIAVGCTGGRHRSVAVIEELRRRLGADWDFVVRHRDLERGGR